MRTTFAVTGDSIERTKAPRAGSALIVHCQLGGLCYVQLCSLIHRTQQSPPSWQRTNSALPARGALLFCGVVWFDPWNAKKAPRSHRINDAVRSRGFFALHATHCMCSHEEAQWQVHVAPATDGGTGRAGSETLPERTAIRKQLPPALSQPTSAIAPAPHLATQSADGRPEGPSRELTVLWYPQAI